MSVFASQNTKTIDVPFDAPQTVTICALSGLKLDKAHKAYFAELIADMSSRGGAKVQKDVEEILAKATTDPTGPEAKEIQDVKADPLHGLDKRTVIYGGLKAWTYPQEIKLEPIADLTADGRSLTVMRMQAVDDLNDEMRDFLATEIMRLTKPALFQTADEQEIARKNASS